MMPTDADPEGPMPQLPDEPTGVSPEDYRVAVERSPDGVLITVPTGRILYANEAACTMLRASEDTIRRSGRRAFAPADDPRWDAPFEERRRTGRTKAVGPLLRADGSRFLAELTSSLFEGTDGAQRSVVIFRDVTARVRLEQRSAALHEVTRALLAGMDTGRVLNTIGRRARQLLDGSDAGIFTPATQPGRTRLAAADGPGIAALLGREYPPGTLAARVMTTRRSLLVDDLAAAAATTEGRDVGLGPGVLVPIVAGERSFGVLVVGAKPGSRPYDRADLDDVKLFAESAAVALAVGEARAELEAGHRRTSEQLQRALESRVVIEQAKGFLAASRDLTPGDAFDRLRRYARSHNTDVHAVASRVLTRALVL